MAVVLILVEVVHGSSSGNFHFKVTGFDNDNGTGSYRVVIHVVVL